MFGQTLGRGASEIVEFLGLGREEFARQAQLAVDGDKARFEFGGLCRQRLRNIGKTPYLAGGIAQGKQPQRNNKQHRYCPLRNEAGPGGRGRDGDNFGLMGPAKETGPAKDRENGKRRDYPCKTAHRFGLRIPFFFEDLFSLVRNWLGNPLGTFGFRGGVIGRLVDGLDQRALSHRMKSTTKGVGHKPKLTTTARACGHCVSPWTFPCGIGEAFARGEAGSGGQA